MELHHAGSSSALADGFGTWHAAEVQWLGSFQVLIEREVFKDVSHEKNPGWLGYKGGYTTQLYRDYNTPLIRIPINYPV